MKKFDFDFVVIGSGLAGLMAAFHASAHGSVALISKSELDVSNSYHAQGGIAAAIGTDDDPINHFNDTLTAGRGLCDHDAVTILVEEGLAQVRNIIAMGLEFDKEPNGELLLGLEGGHSHRRILHADGDATGKIMTGFMLHKILSIKQITPFEYTTAVKIITENSICSGIQTMDYIPRKMRSSTAKPPYWLRRLIPDPHDLQSTYRHRRGFALAWQAEQGWLTEFIQFHPTALSMDGEDAYLISEAVRRRGYLIDCLGERFMLLHPMAELALRDVVASAILSGCRRPINSIPVSETSESFVPERAFSPLMPN